jgi:hypothetical protein
MRGCTLRAAVWEAELAGGTVVLSPATYRLTIPPGAEASGPANPFAGDLDIDDPIDVVGAGVGVSVIDGMNTNRIFDVHRGGSLWLRGVTLTNGKADYDGDSGHVHGGAIHNHGKLSLDHVAVVNSSSTSPGWGGGGITNAGQAWLWDVTVARNRSGARGGGIENKGTMSMLDVTVAENFASHGGEGIYLAPHSVMLAWETLVAKNRDGKNCAGPGFVKSFRANLQGDPSCRFNRSTDRTGDPGFNPHRPGPPLFYPLLPTSRAIDTTSWCFAPDDIRRVPRPQDGNGDGTALCDTGSYERGP